MKTVSTLTALLLAASAAWSMPLEERQNDVPDCVDGTTEEQIGPFQEYGQCSSICYGREQADGDNKNGVCRGTCTGTNSCGPTSCVFYYICEV